MSFKDKGQNLITMDVIMSFKYATLFLLSLSILWLAGCAGSSPTDALAAASDAIGNAISAEDCAPEEYRAAQRLLEQAQAANEAGDYERAEILANSAQEQAERARLVALTNTEDCPIEEELDTPYDEIPNDRDYIQGEVVEPDYALVPVYFGFDAFSLDQESRQTLLEHAAYLATLDLLIVIEGHCDEEGTDSYNLALGENRARSVARFLVTQGIPEDRIAIISYGEFRPASSHNSNLNRRAEFKLRTR
jgi:peptidoglycan-associated lipoprotein